MYKIMYNVRTSTRAVNRGVRLAEGTTQTEGFIGTTLTRAVNRGIGAGKEPHHVEAP
jgi:hypothetical protein